MAGSFREINADDFDDIIAEGIVLAEFWLPLSHPCLIQDPVLNDICRELGDQLRIIRVNAEDVPELKKKYDIRAVPTFLLFQNGREAKRFVGVKSKDSLLGAIDDLLFGKKKQTEI